MDSELVWFLPVGAGREGGEGRGSMVTHELWQSNLPLALGI